MKTFVFVLLRKRETKREEIERDEGGERKEKTKRGGERGRRERETMNEKGSRESKSCCVEHQAGSW